MGCAQSLRMAKRALGCVIEKARAVSLKAGTLAGSTMGGPILTVGVCCRQSMKRSYWSLPGSLPAIACPS